MYCRKCGLKLDQGAIICPQCQTTIIQNIVPRKIEVRQSSSWLIILIIAILVLILLVVIIGAGFLFYKQMKPFMSRPAPAGPEVAPPFPDEPAPAPAPAPAPEGAPAPAPAPAPAEAPK